MGSPFRFPPHERHGLDPHDPAWQVLVVAVAASKRQPPPPSRQWPSPPATRGGGLDDFCATVCFYMCMISFTSFTLQSHIYSFITVHAPAVCDQTGLSSVASIQMESRLFQVSPQASVPIYLTLQELPLNPASRLKKPTKRRKRLLQRP